MQTISESIEVTQHPLGGYHLRCGQFFDRPIEEIFNFYCDARNLEQITPPWLKFTILTPQPIEMRAGLLLDYRIHLHRIPLRWRTEIAEWNPPYSFIDLQLRGPFRRWFHRHTFETVDGGTRVEDEVHYIVPLGSLVHRLFVGRDVSRIFEYRYARLRQIFPLSANSRAGFRAGQKSATELRTSHSEAVG